MVSYLSGLWAMEPWSWRGLFGYTDLEGLRHEKIREGGDVSPISRLKRALEKRAGRSTGLLHGDLIWITRLSRPDWGALFPLLRRPTKRDPITRSAGFVCALWTGTFATLGTGLLRYIY